MKSTAREIFENSNISFEIINIDQQPDHPALAYLAPEQNKSYPAAVLISPDGHALPIPIGLSGPDFKQSLKKNFNSILFSDIRSDLQQKVSLNYGVILLVEGRDRSENQQAKKAIGEAIARVTKNMDLMPKPIKNAPVMIVYKNDQLTSDPVLLWTLGLDAARVDKPHAAIFYGRARWLGPLFKNKEISRNNISEILHVIGADCECGLDKNWLRGTMMPMRWNKEVQTTIAENLGFDPDNPMIKMEINHIMRTGYYNPEGDKRSAGLDSVSGNRPGIVDATEVTPEVKQKQETLTENFEKNEINKSFYFSIAILIIVIGAGLIIIFRRTRIKKNN